MVSIDISDEQREYLEQLRVQLAAEHVGPYGHVRTRDALQYLIDYSEGDAPTTDAASTSTTTTAPAAAPAESAESTTSAASADATDGAEASTNATASADAGTAGGAAADADADATDDDEADGRSRLERMMGLLDDHDDKWDPVESEQGKYVVELPDGEHEFARTKDDVRAVLFKHYR